MDYANIVSQYGVPPQSWEGFPSNVRKRIKKAIRKRKSPTTIAGRLYSAMSKHLPATTLGAVPITLRRRLRESHHAYLTVKKTSVWNPSKTMTEHTKYKHTAHSHDTPQNHTQLKNTDTCNLTPTLFLALPPASKHIEHLSSQSQLTFGRSILRSPLPNAYTSPSHILKAITSPRSRANFHASMSNPTHLARRVLERSIRKRKHNQNTMHNTRDTRVFERCKRKRANAELMLLEMKRSIVKKSRLPTSSRGLRLCAYSLEPAS